MDWSLLRQKAKNCRPREELPPKRWYVAILEVDKSPDATLVEQDFLWIKVHGVSYPKSAHGPKLKQLVYIAVRQDGTGEVR
jgi:hypothetical protein